ncbi:MAG: flagellar protein FlaG [Bacillota bacterium]|jgi:flagellar protein FlaG|nr:flagellar protein FlaG [Bacillota bacterium]
MALEITKASAYQSNITTQASVSDATNVKLDAGNDFIRNTKSTGQHDNDKNEALVSDEHIKSEISKANSRLKTHNTKCEFGYHEGTNRVTIKVLDKDTSEVLREIPPEKTLEMIQKMWELAGILIDERR